MHLSVMKWGMASGECNAPVKKGIACLGVRRQSRRFRTYQSGGSAALLNAQQLGDRLDEMRRLDGLADVRVGAEGQAALAVLLGSFGGDDDDGDVLELRVLADQRDQLEAVHHRHVDVGEDQVDLV